MESSIKLKTFLIAFLIKIKKRSNEKKAADNKESKAMAGKYGICLKLNFFLFKTPLIFLHESY